MRWLNFLTTDDLKVIDSQLDLAADRRAEMQKQIYDIRDALKEARADHKKHLERSRKGMGHDRRKKN